MRLYTVDIFWILVYGNMASKWSFLVLKARPQYRKYRCFNTIFSFPISILIPRLWVSAVTKELILLVFKNTC